MSDLANLDKEEMIRQIESRREYVIADIHTLKKRLSNKTDYYFKELLRLSKQDYFFETWMVINWIGNEMSPKRVMEIGTRNGGSLVALLRPYTNYDDVNVICFDIWKEIGSPRKVISNLKYMNIPTDLIEFHSGDSKITVPQYTKEHPQAQFDYILVDGGHDFETADTDLKNVESLVAPGGILIFDDISTESYGLLPVWDKFKSRNADKFKYFEVMHRKGIAWAFRKEE